MAAYTALMSLHTLTPGKNAPSVVNVVIEIPKGSNNKYELDHNTGLIKLDRVLYSPLFYPADYGYIPGTLGDDGDPLDALVLVTNPTFPGTLIEARVLGYLGMIDGGQGDEKLLCVPMCDPRFRHVNSIKDVAPHVLEEIAHFFRVYKDLEKKKVEIQDWHDAKEAHAVVQKAVKNAVK